MTRRTKSGTIATSAGSMVDALVNVAKGPPVVPAHVSVSATDRPFWDGIIRARAREEWTEADLVVAAQLARSQADIERESAALAAEGSILTNARGTQVMNPRVTVLEQLTRRQMLMMRSLRMAGRVLGTVEQQAGRRRLERQAESLRDELAEEDDEELLAR